MPKGLIPLMLSPSSTESSGSRTRCSTVLPTRNYAKLPVPLPTTPAHKRNASDITPMIRSRPPIRVTKRQSQQVPASLPVLPYTPAEWKKAIVEIKRFHITKRHRACSARCSEILTNTKDISMVEPAYLIYLNFYAAMSLEICARPLQPASSYRTCLLQQARGHYEKASSLIRTAEGAIMSRSRSSSPGSSVPSLHSPSGSVSSRTWTPGTMSPISPTARKSSLQQERKKQPKKVSFELPKDKSQWSFDLSEPIVRPDSPTLGFDDEYFAAGASRQELPALPPRRWSRQDFDAERIETVAMTSPPSMPSISECEELSPASSPSCDGDSFEGFYFARYDENSDSDSDSDSEVSQSRSRYCETLSSLQRQVSRHMSSLNELLRSDQRLLNQEQQQPESPLLQDATSAMTAGLNRMSLESRRRSSIMSSNSYGSSGDEDEARVQDRRARIDRLRMNGWKRERFDASRYEELCEQVMAELAVKETTPQASRASVAVCL
ncbi:hypothetical protein VSDG_08017 [Cytospora chrysosperma]|uniref:Uncharacterized protein n=1 Tax=Cytospora chrysosperma TaxID=252740 RepID=A0A423VIT9_CYTCH|nr:hypothetical protein VSDG_08017 [Valsa sordida]